MGKTKQNGKIIIIKTKSLFNYLEMVLAHVNGSALQNLRRVCEVVSEGGF